MKCNNVYELYKKSIVDSIVIQISQVAINITQVMGDLVRKYERSDLRGVSSFSKWF